MKFIIKSIFLLCLISVIGACQKDEGKLPEIAFKAGASYISSDISLAAASMITIGIDASKSEEQGCPEEIQYFAFREWRRSDIGLFERSR